MYEETLDAGVPRNEGEAEEERDEAFVPAVPLLARPGTSRAEGGEMER